MTKADIELFTQGVSSFKKLSLLCRLGQVPIWGFCSALGSPTTALTLGCHCGDMSSSRLKPLERDTQFLWFPSPQDLGVLSCPRIP